MNERSSAAERDGRPSPFADEPGCLEPSGVHRAAGSLVAALLSSLRAGDPDDLWSPLQRLQRAATRLALADPRSRARAEATLVELFGPLGVRLPHSRQPSRRGRRDSARLARRLACTIEQLLSPPGETGLGIAQLTIRYGRVDLADFVRGVCAAFHAFAADRRLAFHVDTPASLPADVDAAAIELVLANLLFNAVKHAPDGGRVECSLREDGEAGDVIVRVTDSGPPVVAAEVEALFDRSRHFDRSVHCELGGVRMNLGISRDLVELHGGTLTLDDAPGANGASFRACLPRRALPGFPVTRPASRLGALAARVAEVAARELREERALTMGPVVRDGRPLVLVVDDSAALLRVIAHHLEADCATACALDAGAGLERAVSLRPDLVITDLSLPGPMDGAALLRALRAQRELSHVPVLVLTATSDPSVLIELLESGAQDVLRKPVLLPELRARVRNLLEAKRTRDVLAETAGQQERSLVELAREVTARQRELASAMRALDEARRAAESASQIKTNFLRMMSHELKTPITALQLQMRIVERRSGASECPKLSEGFARMTRSSRRMLHLVDTVLEWARVESGSCHLKVAFFDLVELVGEIVDELSGLVEQKEIGVVLRTSGHLPVIASDRRLVHLLLMNVLGRAVRITESGVVEVELGMDGSAHRLSVRDGGPRVAPGAFAELLDPLASASDLVRAGGTGSGLGLHVVRDIALALDGEVTLQPSQAPGNVLVVRLPSLAAERTTARMRLLAPRGRLDEEVSDVAPTAGAQRTEV